MWHFFVAFLFIMRKHTKSVTGKALTALAHLEGGYVVMNEERKVAGIYIRVSTEDQARGVPCKNINVE